MSESKQIRSIKFFASLFLFKNIKKMNSKDRQPWRHSTNRPIYVFSRIQNLEKAILNEARKYDQSLCLINTNLPDDSDILTTSDVKVVSNAEVVVIDTKILALNYKMFPSLKWAYCTWAGVEPLFEILKEKPPFLITRHGGEDFCEQMAEYVLSQVLNYERNFKGIWKGEEDKSWSKMLKNLEAYSRNRPLKELVITILGVGNMGQAVAKFFKPHGTTLIGLSRNPRKPYEFGYFDRIVVSLKEALYEPDYLVNTLPSTKDTIGLLNGEVLKYCLKKPVFINVGRANIINEEDLLNALSNQWLSHAILDVFKDEPLAADSLLWDKVTVTPHIAAISRPNYIAKDFLLMLGDYDNNKPLKNLVNWEAGY